jgi:hypothetical protein
VVDASAFKRACRTADSAGGRGGDSQGRPIAFTGARVRVSGMFVVECSAVLEMTQETFRAHINEKRILIC